MEQLHLTYNEVLRVIPYRNLLIMQKDKMHSVDKRDVVHEVTEAEEEAMFAAAVTADD